MQQEQLCKVTQQAAWSLNLCGGKATASTGLTWKYRKARFVNDVKAWLCCNAWLRVQAQRWFAAGLSWSVPWRGTGEAHRYFSALFCWWRSQSPFCHLLPSGRVACYCFLAFSPVSRYSKMIELISAYWIKIDFYVLGTCKANDAE